MATIEELEAFRAQANTQIDQLIELRRWAERPPIPIPVHPWGCPACATTAPTSYTATVGPIPTPKTRGDVVAEEELLRATNLSVTVLAALIDREIATAKEQRDGEWRIAIFGTAYASSPIDPKNADELNEAHIAELIGIGHKKIAERAARQGREEQREAIAAFIELHWDGESKWWGKAADMQKIAQGVREIPIRE